MADSHSLLGKVSLVTGGSRGLGPEIVRALAGRGSKVAVNYLESVGAAHKLCRELSATGVQVEPIQADVSDMDEIRHLVSKTWSTLGPIDILVNNIGPYVDTPFLDLSVNDFDFIMSTNVRATYLVTQVAGKLMKARGSGSVINIAATDSYYRSHSVYGLAKAGVVYLTAAMALELAPEVRMNAISPDLIGDNQDMNLDFVQRSVLATPMGRLVRRTEVAEMVCLLTSESFNSVTGQTIVMDGGRSIHRIPFGKQFPVSED